jgi:hypothetical protein
VVSGAVDPGAHVVMVWSDEAHNQPVDLDLAGCGRTGRRIGNGAEQEDEQGYKR